MTDSGKRPERDERGRLLPGHSSPGPGRTPLPDWLKGKSEEILRIQLDALLTGRLPLEPDPDKAAELDEEGNPKAVATTQEVPASVRLEVAERLSNRLHGKAPASVEVEGDAMQVIAAILRDKA